SCLVITSSVFYRFLLCPSCIMFLFFFFSHYTATTEIYTLSLHDALPISDSALPPSAVTSFTTVDGLFARIRGYQHQDWLRDVVVTFDPQLGYPTSINVFAKTGIMDADYGQFIQNLRAAP